MDSGLSQWQNITLESGLVEQYSATICIFMLDLTFRSEFATSLGGGGVIPVCSG
jgi:hypothetical protein